MLIDDQITSYCNTRLTEDIPIVSVLEVTEAWRIGNLGKMTPGFFKYE